MSAQAVAETIQLIIAPTVLLTVCALIQNGVLGRFMALGSRIRSLDQERLKVLHSESLHSLQLETLKTIDYQIPVLIRRHKLLQDTVLIIYSSMIMLLVCMFAIALSVALTSGSLARLALVLFLLSAATLLIGLCLAAQEVRISHHAICYEIHRISTLEKPILK